MRFNPKARLDTRRVRDTARSSGGGSRRGGGGLSGGLGSRSGLPIPGGLAGGGSVAGVVIAVLVVVLTQCVGGGGGSGGYGDILSGALGGSSLDTARFSGSDSGRYASCQTGEDANGSSDCARVAVENSLTDFWTGELGAKFEPEQSVETFTGQTSTGCGGASAAVGPFYCPADSTIYLDTSFFADVLERQLGGPEGGFVEPYVLAHEYGHHIQNLLGTMSKVRTQQGATSDAVRLELQADCYAGMWTRAATSTQDADGNVLISELTQTDIAQALDAASSVGDDKIQQKTQGQVDSETWTHGSAEERMRWFTTGYEQGSLQGCDTFSAGSL